MPVIDVLVREENTESWSLPAAAEVRELEEGLEGQGSSSLIPFQWTITSN